MMFESHNLIELFFKSIKQNLFLNAHFYFLCGMMDKPVHT